MNAPPLLYGTAWKEDATEELVVRALHAGFRGVDTANQRKHYHEEGVGRALARAFGSGLAREELFVQTKFTFLAGQDHRLPYDPEAPIATQVRQSFARSREHLGVDVVDSLVLHGPSRRVGVGPADEEAWRAMEGLVDDGHVRALGVSNVSAAQLARFVALARVPVTFVQNRCYASLEWDADTRACAREHGVTYQGFSLLTANRAELAQPRVHELARARGCTVPQLVFAFARQRRMIALTGTTSDTHMQEDLASVDVTLDDDELALLDEL